MNRERRTIPGRVETRALTEAEKTAGYIGALTGIIPLNTDSVPLRDRRLNNGQPFVERIAPQAFAGATDVLGMAGHTDDPLAAFARQGSNLTIVETATEMRWEALLPNTAAARDLLELGEKKIIRGTSFEFDLGAEDQWEKRSDGTAVRTVIRGRLATVNPVVWPAYDDSSLSVSLRGRGALGRNCYFGNDIAWDSTATPDTIYALCALGHELCEMSDAIEYLRANPDGDFADYARETAAESAADIATLAAWLAANGDAVDPAVLERAKNQAAAARSPAAPIQFAEDARETRLRLIVR